MEGHVTLRAVNARISHEIQTVVLPWLLRVILGYYIDPIDVDKAARDSIHMNYPRLSKEQKADLKKAVESRNYRHMDTTLLVKLIR